MSEERNEYKTADELAEAGYISEAVEMLGIELESIPRSKKIETEISGFTPIFDAVIEDYHDETIAAVFGIIWRHCQMEDGVCKASLETLADWIGVDRVTIMRHAKTLCEDGYIKDLTPNLKNRPHIYADCGKIVMRQKLGVTKSNSVGMTQRNAAMTQRNRGMTQSHLNKVLKKDSNKESINATQKIDFMSMSVQEAMRLPSIQTYHHATNYFPGNLTWELVHNTVTEHKLTKEKIHAAAVEWRARGFRLENIAGILDWAVNGIPEQKQKSGKQTKRRQSDEKPDQYDYDALRAQVAAAEAKRTGAAQ